MLDTRCQIPDEMRSILTVLSKRRPISKLDLKNFRDNTFYQNLSGIWHLVSGILFQVSTKKFQPVNKTRNSRLELNNNYWDY